METLRREKASQLVAQFKSYYVVWKLHSQTAPRTGYIVFKSYYVVWKPADMASIDIVLASLNRTM